MPFAAIVLLGGFGITLFLILRWLATYSSEDRNANSGPAWMPGGFVAFLTGRSRDTTVSAYARQVQEHARENDSHAERLMADVKVEEFQRTETTTEARTEVPKPL